MTTSLAKTERQRRVSAIVLLFVWFWCLVSTTFALAMAMDFKAAAQMTMASELVSDAAHHQLSSSEAVEDPSTTPECCPEESDSLAGQILQSNLFTAALLSYLVIALFGLQPFFIRVHTHRLIPLPSIRLHALHCTYLN